MPPAVEKGLEVLHLFRCSTHTQLCHTHHLPHTTLSHTIFHTHLGYNHLSHTSLSHTIFHTQRYHTPSSTHIFVTHQLSHTSWLHTIFATHPLPHTHTQLFHMQHCHTPSFTHNFSTHNSSHTTFLVSSIIHHLPCLSCLPHPAATLCSDYWKKLTCGVIRSFNLWQPSVRLFAAAKT